MIYRRIAAGEGEAEPPKAERGESRRPPPATQPAPALKTVVVGFALLLLLIVLLGYLSVRKADEVSAKILDDERRHAGIRDFTLELRIATTKLDNEARARARKMVGETQETRPLTETRLNSARDEVKKLFMRLGSPSFSDKERWRRLAVHLASFVQATEDPDAYLREGYVKFRDADNEINALLVSSSSEQRELFERYEQLQQSAARRIYLLTAVALLMGALVAAYTIREMQRRFRELRESMEEARREREFSTQMLEGMVSAVAAIDAHDHIRSANG
ncbi:MAG: hypothetical protein LC672_04225, partial [Acidobacteria bacterium]|nr:hypothetical protein [Acidobacteriota bacterium]